MKLYIGNTRYKVYVGTQQKKMLIYTPNPTPVLPSNPVPNDEIWYTTNDDTQLIGAATVGYGANFVSNTYTNGKGVIKFDGDINNIPEEAFSNRNKLYTIALPDSVTAIHGKAFSNCYNLEQIQLGTGLLTMNDDYYGLGGSFTFDDCYSLEKIVSLKPNAPQADAWCFHDFREANSSLVCELCIPSGATGYDAWKYTVVGADNTPISFSSTKTLEASDYLFLNT